MMYMLDTNIIIYLIKNKPQSVAEHVAALSPNDHLVMSFITYGELLKGANGSKNREKSLCAIARLTETISVVYPDENICTHYGKWADTLKRQGTPIGGNDLWIACHALACQAVLVTHNTREFGRIGGLSIEDWVEE